jgi:hypothetical protein
VEATLVACRSETVSSAIEAGAPRLDFETWVHLFVRITIYPRQATRGVRLPDLPNRRNEGLTAITTDAHKPKAH